MESSGPAFLTPMPGDPVFQIPRFPFLLLLSLTTTPAFADDLAFKGRLTTQGVDERGDVSIGSKSISVETGGVLRKESHAYTFAKMASVHASRGLLHTKIEMQMEEGKATVYITTKRRYYAEINSTLKDKL